MRKMKKMQIAMEAGIFLFLLVLILLALIMFNYNVQQEFLADRNAEDVRKIGETIADNINAAVTVGDGYEGTFTIAFYLSSGDDYDFQLFSAEQRIILNYTTGSYSARLLTSNVTGTIKKGSNKIKNVNGGIRIE